MTEMLRDFVDLRTRERGFSTPSEYIRSLVHSDRERRERERAWSEVETLLINGIESGEAEPITPEFFQRLRAEVVKRRGDE